MKRFICMALTLALLCGCLARQSAPAPESPAVPPPAASPAAAPPSPAASPAPAAPSAAPVPLAPSPGPKKVSSNPDWSAEQTIEAYFDAHYQSYLTFEDIDISGLLDETRSDTKNLQTWLKMLNQRRRLLKEHSLCYVETEAFPYEIVYEQSTEDNRMDFWQRRMDEQYDAIYHLRVRGEEGRAYPPTFALNAQHSIFLKKVDGAWRIVRHYYPGAVRNFYFSEGLTLPGDDEALALLREEFAPAGGTAPPDVPEGARAYDPRRAVDYALRHAERPNGTYYNIGDWRGNCQNFVSQVISCGFGDEQDPNPMTSDWFAGSGGGSPAWENCDWFWDFAVTNGGMGGQQLASITQLRAGDILQLRSLGRNNPDDFSHVLFMVDPEKGLFAQNSPANFVYYSDLVNIASRFFRPAYLYA